MKVATYNIRVDTDYDQLWQWRYRCQHVLSLVEYHDWDIWAAQEVRPVQLKDLQRLSSYDLLFSERDGDGLGEGITIFYKKELFEKAASGTFWLSLTPEKPSIHPEAAYRRLCLWTILTQKSSGRQMLVVTAHLDHSSENARYEGMKVIFNQLKDFISAYPVLLLGDLNAEENERVHKLLKEQFVQAKESSEKGHYGPKGTFQNFNYQADWQELEEIDYIYTKNFQVVKTGVLTDSCDRRFPSDHFPLEAEIHFV